MNIDQLKKPISDMIYSMIAYALSSVVLTFLIQPMMASYMDGDQYGLFLTLINIK